MNMPLNLLLEMKQKLDACRYGETDKRNQIFEEYSQFGDKRTLHRRIRAQFGGKRAPRCDAGENNPELRKGVELVVELKKENHPKFISTKEAIQLLLDQKKIPKNLSHDSVNRIIKEKNLLPEEKRRPSPLKKIEHNRRMENTLRKNKEDTIIKLNEELESVKRLAQKTKTQLEKKVDSLYATSTKLKHENHRLIIECNHIKEFVSIHGNKYGLDHIEFKGNEPIVITCQHHGLVSVEIDFFKSHGCPVCQELESFKQQVRDIYGDLFNYDLIKSMYGKLAVYCKNHEGLFFTNKDDLLKGKGCNCCCENKNNPRVGILEEKAFLPILREINNDFKPQFPVSTTMGVFFIDFYFPKLNIAVEFDEEYHNAQDGKDRGREEIIKEILGCSFIRVPEKDIDNEEKILELLQPLGT